MTKIIAVANQKGGVGKTTTAVNLAASLVALGQRVLLVDLDPQGNATMGSGVNKHELPHTINEALLQEACTSDLIVTTESGFALIPANGDLTSAEIGLLQQENREIRLQQLLAPLLDNYDFILLDCPPSLNMLTVNALVAANGVLIPMQCEYFALEGLNSLLNTVESVRTVNPDLHIAGILRTLYDGRNSLSKQVAEQLLTHFKDQVYRTVIPRNVRLAEAPSHGQPVLLYDRYSAGAAAYLALAEEVLYGHEEEQTADNKSVADDTLVAANPPNLLRTRSKGPVKAVT